MQGARARGEEAVVATVVGTTVPDILAGMRLLVFADGRREGRVEAELDEVVVASALEALTHRRSSLASFERAEGGWARARPQSGAVDIFFEVLAQPPHIVIVGAGHIAVPLAQIASLLEFRVTVLDDRPEYATPERFPTAHELLVGPYAETLASVPTGRDTFVVLVTRGHVHDQACLELMLEREPAYIGMIGSKRRVRTVMENLARRGFDPQRLKSVFAPVGLDIRAQSPGEIAVAILAEIINVRRGGQAPSVGPRAGLRV